MTKKSAVLLSSGANRNAVVRGLIETRQRALLVVAGAGTAATLLLAACGTSTTSPSTSTSSTVPPSAPKATATVQVATNASFGKILVDSSGMTLYTFGKDTPRTSNCTGPCATAWPPLLFPSGVSAPVAGSGVTGLGNIARSDGRLQVTHNNQPLYRYVLDQAPGQANGNGVNAFGGIWHVVSVSTPGETGGGVSSSTSSPSPPSSTGTTSGGGGYGRY